MLFQGEAVWPLQGDWSGDLTEAAEHRPPFCPAPALIGERGGQGTGAGGWGPDSYVQVTPKHWSLCSQRTFVQVDRPETVSG